jgi:hypothetical protein
MAVLGGGQRDAEQRAGPVAAAKIRDAVEAPLAVGDQVGVRGVAVAWAAGEIVQILVEGRAVRKVTRKAEPAASDSQRQRSSHVVLPVERMSK